jgi:hypothetical protein
VFDDRGKGFVGVCVWARNEWGKLLRRLLVVLWNDDDDDDNVSPTQKMPHVILNLQPSDRFDDDDKYIWKSEEPVLPRETENRFTFLIMVE